MECFVQPYKDEPQAKRARTIPQFEQRWIPSIDSHTSSSGSSSSVTPEVHEKPTASIPVRQSIPLSHILHPQSEELTYPRYVLDTIHHVVPPLDRTVCSVTGEEVVEEEEVEEIIPERQNLQFIDPGMKQVMYKRMAYGGSPRTVGGMLDMLNSFNVFPVKTSLRNAELFNFCKHPLESKASIRPEEAH